MNHPWNVRPRDAIKIQKILREKLILKKDHGMIARIAGVDVSFYQDEKRGRCAIIVYSYPQLDIIERSIVTRKIRYPYIPGLLTFREGPLVLAAYKRLKLKPDVLIFDGHGIAHPRRMGIASHMGILLNKPSVGCAKNILCGDYREPDKKRGAFSYIRDGRNIIGAAVRTRDSVKCVFVSAGHKIDLAESIKIILNITPKYRISEPLRMAHLSSSIR